MMSATSSAADMSRLTRSQFPATVLRDPTGARPWNLCDEQSITAGRPTVLLAAELNLDEIEARVTHVGFGEQPQISYVLSHRVGVLGDHAGGGDVGQKKRRARGPPFSGGATQLFGGGL